jgi:G3E family GTPase
MPFCSAVSHLQIDEHCVCLKQGVHAVFDGSPGKPWQEGEAHKSRIVFIGRDLDAAALQEGFQSCLA